MPLILIWFLFNPFVYAVGKNLVVKKIRWERNLETEGSESFTVTCEGKAPASQCKATQTTGVKDSDRGVFDVTLAAQICEKFFSMLPSQEVHDGIPKPDESSSHKHVLIDWNVQCLNKYSVGWILRSEWEEKKSPDLRKKMGAAAYLEGALRAGVKKRSEGK